MNEKTPQETSIRPDLARELPVDQQPAPPQSYDEVFPDAQEAFAQCIADVHEYGDAFDKRRSLHARVIVRQATIPVVVAAELTAANNVSSPLGAATAVGIGGYILWKNTRSDRKVLEAHKSQAQEAGQATGQSFELYRQAPLGDEDPSAQTILVWYGPASTEVTDQFGTLECLRQMAAMAKEQGVAQMHVDAEQYKHIRSSLQISGGVTYTASWSIMNDAKKVHLNMDMKSGRKSIIAGTPDRWLEFVKDRGVFIESGLPEGAVTLPNVLDKLRLLKPAHPMLSIAEAYSTTDSDVAKEAFRRGIQKATRMTLFRQEQYPERARYQKIHGIPYLPSEVVDNEPGHIAPDASAVVWQTRYNGHVSQDIYRAFGLSRAEYGRLVAGTPEDVLDASVDDLVSALEIAIIRAAHGQPVEAERSEARKKLEMPVGFCAVETLQAELSKKAVRGHVNTLPHRLRQTAASALALGALWGVGFAGHRAMEAKESYAIEKTQIRLANRHHISPEFVTEEDAKNYLSKHSGKWRAWNAYSDREDAINKTWDDILPDFQEPPSKQMPPASSSSTTSRVGNTHLPDIANYTVVPHNNASSEGFWAASTASTLILQKPSEVWGIGFRLTWKQAEVARDKLSLSTLPVSLPRDYAHRPNLEVQRDLVDEDSYRLHLGSSPVNSNLKFLANIPVLEHTRPVAASLNGEKVPIVSKPDGTYAVTNAGGARAIGALKYWLAPDPGAPMAHSDEALQFAIQDDAGTSTTYLYGVGVLSAPEVGRVSSGQQYSRAEVYALGGDVLKRQEHKAQAYSNMIAKTWKYTQTPFKRDQEDYWKSLDDFVVAAGRGQKANCNVANTLAGLYDVGSAQVMGYTNHPGSGARVLSSNEAHQKRTTGDATPTVQETRLPAERVVTLPVSPAQIALLGAGLMLATQHRRLRRATFRAALELDNMARSKRAKQIAQLSPRDAAEAQAAIEQYYYAPAVTLAGLNMGTDRVLRQSPVATQPPVLPQALLQPGAAESLRTLSRRRGDNPELARRLARSADVLGQMRQITLDQAGEPGFAVAAVTKVFDTLGKPLTYLRRKR